METFSHFEILDTQGNRVVEGHKVRQISSFYLYLELLCQASFCLEDNDCHGVDPKYNCENYGDQVRSSDMSELCSTFGLCRASLQGARISTTTTLTVSGLI